MPPPSKQQLINQKTATYTLGAAITRPTENIWDCGYPHGICIRISQIITNYGDVSAFLTIQLVIIFHVTILYGVIITKRDL
ncbi:hypothetical protein GCM10027286_30890 [Virgibacillus ainsalahensis]